MSVTLADQMGAMALIDDMRHREMVVQEHLNLPAIRQEVAQRIREYYASKAIEVDPAIVDKGVRDFFARRLCYESAPPSPLAAGVAQIFIRRDKWLRPVALALAGIVAATTCLYGVNSYLDHRKADEVQASADASMQMHNQLDDEIRRQQAKLAEMQHRVAAAALPAAERLLFRVPDALTDAQRLIAVAASGRVTAQLRDAASESVAHDTTAMHTAATKLKESSDTLDAVDTLLGVKARYDSVVQSAGFKSGRDRYPAMRSAAAVAAQAIDSADTKGVAASGDAVTKLINVVSAVGQIDVLRERQAGLVEQFGAMRLSGEDAGRVDAMSNGVTRAIDKFDATGAQAALDALSAALTYAKTPLSLNIVDRTGVKSGAERNYRASSGKSWFLIVEATDPSGQVVTVPVKSAETGVTANAKLFGVRVTQAEYERVKADKRADGHVDDRFVGQKPASSLTFQFTPRTAAKPDMILEW